MSRVTCVALLLCILLLLAPAVPVLASEGWPQLRGPHHDGKGAGAGLDNHQRIGLERVWKKPLGSGFSAVVAVDGKALTMFSEGDDDVLAAFDATSGQELWRYRVGDRYVAYGNSSDGPLSTPVIDGDRVYGLSPWGKIFAVALADGKELWARLPQQPAEARRPVFGFSTSPVLAGGVLVVQTGGEAERSITALDPATGKLRWALGDDSVQYQSPLPFELEGREILLALSDHRLLGLDPETGITLWAHEHGLEGRAAVPTKIGNRRLLLNGNNELLALDVVGSAGGPYTLKEAWRSRELTRSLALPVLDDGVLYGFTGRFLTAIDAATGERLWKSRPPGGRSLILVDHHLVTLDPQGELVIGAVSRDGFHERARASALAGRSFTAPTYADGLFFVRDLEGMAALRISDANSTGSEPLVTGELANLLSRFPRESRQAAIDSYLDGRAVPLIDEDGWVHFVYRGEHQDVALAGQGLISGETEVAMQQVPESNLWARSLRLDSSTRRRYQFVVDYEQRLADPGNPNYLTHGEVRLSELRLPHWLAPEHQGRWDGASGRLEEMLIDTSVYAESQSVQVYLPAGYDEAANSGDYPLLIVTQGGRVQSNLELPAALDLLIGRQRVEPLIAVLIKPAQRSGYREGAEEHLQFLTEDLLPSLEERWRLRTAPWQRGLIGTADGGYAALHAVLNAPETFGRAAAQSFYAGADKITALGALASGLMTRSQGSTTNSEDKSKKEARAEEEGEDNAAPSPHRFYLDWTRFESHSRALAMATALNDAGLDYLGGEVEGTSEEFSWAERLDRPLETLFPAAIRRTAPGLNDSWESSETKPLVERLEREGREIFAHRELLAAVVGARPGMVIADVGAGSGFMALEFAKLVGDEGRVVAVDINPVMMEELAAKAGAAGVENLQTRVCRQDSVDLEPASVDLVFLADTYHHFEYPTLTLASIRRALRPGGQVVLVDFERLPGESPEWILNHVRAGKKQVTSELRSAGFELLAEHPLPQLKNNYVLRFQRR